MVLSKKKKEKNKVVNTVRTRRNSSNKVGNSIVQKIMYCRTVEILEADDFETLVIPCNNPPPPPPIPVKGRFHI
jgi:hypothetical protein